MEGDKAPSSDGLPPSFFKKSLEILKNDIWEMVEESGEKYMSKEINNTFITLMPKKDIAQTFEDLRPISLCNTTYKIIEKVMVNKLKKILLDIISEEHSEFTSNRSIVEGIIIAHEVIHTVKRAKTNKILIKLDTRKNPTIMLTNLFF